MKAFVFEPARCTGCEACRVACSIENRLPLDQAWRSVHHANPEHLPGVPALHLSLACNHCERPACLEGCPALAYSRDAATGAVLLDGDRCIGCRYCSWMCPYDAPVFDPRQGLMSKCTFCHSRQVEGRAPACAAACPTGALGVEERGELPEPVFPGLPNRGLGPALRIVDSCPPPLQGGHAPSAEGLAWMGRPESPGPRISLRTEWSLLAFTLLLPLLAGAQLASTLTGRAVLPAFAVLALGGLAGGLSLLHLGRPLRAWRALSNLGSSWLSREILAFSIFVPLATAAAWTGAGGIYLATSLAGLLLLFCVDRVYQRAEGRPPWPIRSAEALPAGLFLAGILAGNPVLVWAMATLRLLLFLRPRSIPAGAAAALRVAALLLPCLGPSPTWALLLVVLAGELVDRRAFYLGLDLPEPGALVDGALLRAYPPAAGDPA